MIAGLALFLQVAVAPPNLVIRQAEGIKTVPAIATMSGSYLRADLLAAALGGTAAPSAGGRYRITLGESRIELTEGIPFALVDANVVPMLLPALRSGGTFLVPYQLATSVIPRFTSGFNYDVAASELRIFNTAARRVVEAPQPQASNFPSSTSAPVATPSTVPARPRRTARRLVVVDAGHGGPDNGMTGPIGAGPRIHREAGHAFRCADGGRRASSPWRRSPHDTHP